MCTCNTTHGYACIRTWQPLIQRHTRVCAIKRLHLERQPSLPHHVFVAPARINWYVRVYFRRRGVNLLLLRGRLAVTCINTLKKNTSQHNCKGRQFLHQPQQIISTSEKVELPLTQGFFFWVCLILRLSRPQWCHPSHSFGPAICERGMRCKILRTHSGHMISDRDDANAIPVASQRVLISVPDASKRKLSQTIIQKYNRYKNEQRRPISPHQIVEIPIRLLQSLNLISCFFFLRVSVSR